MQFEEKQGLKIWWLYLITGLAIFPTVAILIFSEDGPNFKELQAMYFAPVFAIFLPFLIIFIIQKNQLTLLITPDGLSYRYFPFHRKGNVYLWESIDKAYVRKFDAFSEYGGYGVKHRLWFKLKDKAYILNDHSKGLQFEFKDGKKVLFSSNKIDELELFLVNLKTKYSIQAIS